MKAQEPRMSRNRQFSCQAICCARQPSSRKVSRAIRQGCTGRSRRNTSIAIGFLCGLLVSAAAHLCVGSYHPFCSLEYLLHSLLPPQQNVTAGNFSEPYNATETGLLRGRRNLLLVGVMTADQFLDSRALAIRRSWARNIPGKVLFFTGGASYNANVSHSVAVNLLPDVTDKYPPQRKSWRMLRHLHDCCGSEYEWFMRADDDLFVRGDRLYQLLARLNSSETLFVGQPGQGLANESLFWNPSDFYCMGGSGVILSRALLHQVVHHIEYCMKQLVFSDHEDVELGRCILAVAGVNCTNSEETITLFYHNSRHGTSFNHSLIGIEPKIAPNHDPFDSAMLTAVTLHDLKMPEFHHRLQNLDYFHQLQRLELRRSLIESWIDDSASDGVTDRFAPWLAFVGSGMYSGKTVGPLRGLPPGHLNELPHHLFQEISSQSRNRKELLSYKFGYSLQDARNGLTFLVGSQISKRPIKVVRVEQNFLHARILNVKDTAFAEKGGVSKTRKEDSIYVVLPAFGVTDVLDRFIDNYLEIMVAKANLRRSVTLLVVVPEMDSHKEQIKKQAMQSGANMEIVAMNRTAFSRATACNAGAAYAKSLLDKERTKDSSRDGILLFIDVDMLFSESMLTRVQANTAPGSMVYYPIVLCEYDPAVMVESPNSPKSNRDQAFFQRWFPRGSVRGFWSFYGYGMVALYVSDWLNYPWNDTIVSWGLEDVELHDRVLTGGKLGVYRAPEPGMVHVFHTANCTARLSALSSSAKKPSNDASWGLKLREELDRFRMCLAAVYSHLAQSSALMHNFFSN